MSFTALIQALQTAIDAGDTAQAKHHLRVLSKDVKALEFRNQRAQRDKTIVSSLLTKVSTDLESSLQVQKRFIASVSHEIRTPLNAIMGFLELLSDSGLNTQQQEWLVPALSSSQHLMTLINDVLDVSKAEAGQLELHPQVIALDELLRETIALMTPKLQDKPVSIHTDIPVLSRYVLADPVRLKQIVLNLLSNAIKFTYQGRIDVSLQIAPIDAKLLTVKITIRDTGIGIPADKIDTLFMPFAQAHRRANNEGTGLGLYLSQALAKLMTGQIILSSEEGVGTSCVVQLTLTQGAEKATPKPISPDAHKAPVVAIGDLAILVVDDVELNRRLMKQILSRYFGVEPQLANDGLEAVSLAKQQPFDLILMDIQMPNMNGLEATQEILKLRPDQVIYALSANAFSEDIEAALAVGMKGFLTKPIQIPLLKEVLMQYSHAGTA